VAAWPAHKRGCRAVKAQRAQRGEE